MDNNLDRAGAEVELRIRLLGGFEASAGPRTIDDAAWKLRKARNLIKLLALAQGHRLHREQVLEALWPDLDPAAAGNNLRKALHYARHALDACSATSSPTCLQAKDDQIILAAAQTLHVDVDAFRQAAATARRKVSLANYNRAISLYTGDLLPEDRYEEWTIAPREELRNTYVQLVQEAARLIEDEGDLRAAIEALRKGLELDPLNEEIHTALMRLYALSGETRQALGQYRRLSDLLRQELDVEPGDAAQLLYNEIKDRRYPVTPPDERAASASSRRPRHNMPVQLTSFIGRVREIAEVERLLAGARLVTLTGAGGSGKTRLALETASRLAETDTFPDGVWLVELGGLSNAALVPQAIAGAIGLQDRSKRPMLETLSEYMQSKRILILLDNCEHLITACATVAENLLRRCPGLRILATSREALNIPGETTWLVPSLSMPDLQEISGSGEQRARGQAQAAGSTSLIEIVARYEAVRLFADRAASALPAFSLADHAAAVAQICHRLDGIPLAIELAAARVRVLSAEQIAGRLDDAFHLLVGGSRTALPRQQTLKATLDWSYDLLTEQERILFDRLSVFAGGFNLEAMEAVCDIPNSLEVLSRLIDKSLVTRLEGEHGGAARYRLLETLRQYGRDRLRERGEEAEIKGRHARYYALLCARAEPQLVGPNQVEWLDRLNGEFDNLRSALDWCRNEENSQDLLQSGLLLASSSPRLWDITGHVSEARGWLSRFLPLVPERTPLRAKGLYSLGHFTIRDWDYAAGRDLELESLAIYEEVGDRLGMAGALERLGVAVTILGDTGLGLSYLQRAIDLVRPIGYKAGLGWVLGSAGMCARIAGDYDLAMNALVESVAVSREAGDLHGIAYNLNNLGQLARVRADYDAAWSSLEECLELSRRMDDKPLIAWTLESLCTVARMRGDYDRARTVLAEAIDVARETGTQGHLAGCMRSAAMLAAHYGLNRNAVRLFSALLASHPNTKHSLDEDEVAEWDRSLDMSRAALGGQEFDAAWTEGESITWDQAIECVVESMNATGNA
jgi:predicted ATPase/DNA-binding SARP family transcriptional activator